VALSTASHQFQDLGEVRTVVKQGEPWFVAEDLCQMLGVEDVPGAVALIPRVLRETVEVETLDGPEQAVVLRESGMHLLVQRANSINSLPLRTWLKETIIPSIEV
jgi:prophage antirepressor-like protein